jgi:IS5 family transposase
MKQKSFASSGFELVTKRTRKREFLDEMNLVVPWTELVALIEPDAPSGKTRIGNSNAPQSPTTRPQPAKTGRLRQ